MEAQGFFKTRRLRMDISGEQTSKQMINYLVSKGINQQLVPHANSPASNPAERQFQTLFRRVLTIKIFAQLPSWLWNELVDAVNRVDAALPVKDNPGGAPPTTGSSCEFPGIGFSRTTISNVIQTSTYDQDFCSITNLVVG